MLLRNLNEVFPSFFEPPGFEQRFNAGRLFLCFLLLPLSAQGSAVSAGLAR